MYNPLINIPTVCQFKQMCIVAVWLHWSVVTCHKKQCLAGGFTSNLIYLSLFVFSISVVSIMSVTIISHSWMTCHHLCL